ncbi:MAG: LysR family transcriptional regulator [Chloroflexi bacterium]|nr:LysR family transcriptional regulator [Chloroflexota bacterium]
MSEQDTLQMPQIEAFLAVARRGSISAAVEELVVSQPAVTARIQGLERALRVDLFVRTRSGSRLTEAGRAFLPHAERTMTAIAAGRRAVADVLSGSGGRLTIGAAPAVSTYVLPAVLHRFQAEHPLVQLSVRSGHSEEVLDMVLREEVEIGLMRPIQHAETTIQPLYSDELVLVVHRGHAFAAPGQIRMADMATEHLILFDRTSSYHELTSSIFRQAGIDPRGYLEVDNIDAAKRMVEQRLGIALLPLTSVQAEIGSGRLAPVTIADMPPVRRQIVVVRRRDVGEPSTIVGDFLRTLEALRPGQTREARFLA